MAKVGLVADGIDSGDAREGSKALPPSGTSSDSQESLAFERDAKQQNISASMPGFQTIAVHWFYKTATYNFIGRWYDPPLEIAYQLIGLDTHFGGGAQDNYYNPSSNAVAATDAFAHEVDAHCSGGMVINPPVNPASANYGTLPYDVGSVATPSGVNLEADFIRLLPKGTYNITMSSPGWASIPGFSGAIYYSTAAGDTLISTVDSAGVYSAGGSPFNLVIAAPWVWIKIILTNVQGSGTTIFGAGFIINSYTP